ncbi:MAG: hypothetical protein KGO05_12930 [Chloroflexota bacterium]|nr:hypothetical protein [Chloroflexota bacterium]
MATQVMASGKSGKLEGRTMGWLFGARRRTQTRPRVANAVAAAHQAYLSAQPARGQVAPAQALGSAVAMGEQIGWAFDTPATRVSDAAVYAAYVEAQAQALAPAEAGEPTRRADFGEIGALIERAEQTARNLGRSRAELWEEALRAWLESQGEAPQPAPRPWLFEARRQRTWGEIDDTLTSLRTA